MSKLNTHIFLQFKSLNPHQWKCCNYSVANAARLKAMWTNFINDRNSCPDISVLYIFVIVVRNRSSTWATLRYPGNKMLLSRCFTELSIIYSCKRVLSQYENFLVSSYEKFSFVMKSDSLEKSESTTVFIHGEDHFLYGASRLICILYSSKL